MPRAHGGADIRVMGLVNPSHLIEDISVGVAFGVTAIIPAGKAAVSKDLWRSISQKFLFRMPSAGPPSQVATPRGVADSASREDAAAIQNRLKSLEVRNSSLEEESRKLREQLAETQEKQQDTLEAILSQLKEAPQVVYAPGAGGSAAAREDLADGDAPNFIPEVIKPDDSEARIESVQESTTSDVSSVAERLKKLRQGSQ